MTLAIIGGTGLDQWPDVTVIGKQEHHGVWGAASGAVQSGMLAGQEILFLPRHGAAHDIPPHRVNYRANIDALRAAGATRIVGVAAVGSISMKFAPGSLAVPEQLIDYSWGRESTFFDGVHEPLQHIEFTEPYDENLRSELLEASERCGVKIADQGTYAVTQGPRLETAAEIRRLAQDGCSMVGMTGMPEAALAKERDIPYACLAFSVNWAAGLADGDIHAQIHECIEQGTAQIRQVLTALVSRKG